MTLAAAAPADPLEGAAFDTLFTRSIEPELKRLERERRRSVMLAVLIWAGFAALVVAECLVWRAFTHGRSSIPDTRVLAVTVVFGLIGGFIPMGDITRKTKLHLIGSLSKPLGLTYTLAPPEPAMAQRLIDLGLLPKPDHRYFEDMFQGRRGACDFTICEARLSRKMGDGSREVFRGQLFQIAFPRRFMGKTVLLRDSGWLNEFACPPGLRRVGLEDPHFEALWEVFADDQIESRAILTPAFMEQMIALEAVYSGRNIRCAFHEGDLLIAVEGEDRFEPVGMFSNIGLRGRALTMANDFAAVVALIDTVAQPARA